MDHRKLFLAIASFTVGLGAFNVHAQDPVTVCPRNFTVLAEDETTRVLHFVQRKGETCGMHSHPYLVAYVIKPGQLTFALPDGTKQQGPKVNAGDVVQRPPTTHAHDAVSDDSEAIVVELKKR